MIASKKSFYSCCKKLKYSAPVGTVYNILNIAREVWENNQGRSDSGFLAKTTTAHNCLK